MKGITSRLALAALVAALSVLTACADKGANVEPTTTSTSPTTIHTSPPVLPSSSIASASPEPGNDDGPG